MALSDHTGPSADDINQRRFRDHHLMLRNKLKKVRLSALDMTGEELASYRRIMGFEYGFLGVSDPDGDDLSIFEMKIRQLK